MKQCFQPQILIWKRDVTVNEEGKERTVYGADKGRYDLVTEKFSFASIMLRWNK